MDLVRDAKFKNSFIFKYSVRPGTKAHELFVDDIPDEVKKRRNNDLLAVQNANSLDDHRQWIGHTVAVLVEGPSKVGERQAPGQRQMTGRTLTDHIVVFDGDDRMIGQTINVRVAEASPFTLYGDGEGIDCSHLPEPSWAAKVKFTRRELPLV
jgi:tRNA-2-methylthio-N6-dimethylallyladenosine synthase